MELRKTSLPIGQCVTGTGGLKAVEILKMQLDKGTDDLI